MSKRFLKSDEVEIKNGGYLISKDGKPVYNGEFIAAQERAEYVVTFAKMCKGKDFKGKQADSIKEVKEEVIKLLCSKKEVYIEEPELPKQTLNEKLKKEALDFMQASDKKESIKKVNNYLQRFNVLKDFEEFGLFFEEEICKLNKIYTVKEITEAVHEIIDLLD
jgi:hypothetical protein